MRPCRRFLVGDVAAVWSFAALLGVGCGGQSDATWLGVGPLDPGVSGAGAATGAGAGASGARPGGGPDGAGSGSTGSGVGGQGPAGTGATGAGAAPPGAGGNGAQSSTAGTTGEITTPDPTPDVPPTDTTTPTCETAAASPPALMLTPVVDGLVLPVFVTASPGDDTRLFVLERQGTIRVVRDGVLLAHPFLDLRSIVDAAGSDEQGLLGLAFHPRYQENRRFFVTYSLVTDDGEEAPTVLAEFVRSEADWDQAELVSERRLLVSRQASPIHHGGMLAFHPLDGLLYVSEGDSGSGTGQDLSTWDGKMLRIDVDTTTDDLPYGIPAGNLSGPGVAREIWSLGLRNPWRFSFDACTANIYIGDVGEAESEEIDFEPANTSGRNYGWDIREGTLCFEESSECSRTDLVPPITEYEHGFGCAVIGGYVYRGQRIPALRGTYFFSDYCNDGFFSLRVESGQLVDERDMSFDLNPAGENLAITSFGVDNAGELYVVNRLGVLYRIDPE